jgi:hypothetical protein
MSNWFEHITHLLANEIHENKLPVETIFDGMYLSEHNLLLHFISIDKVNKIPENYFAQISDAAQQQHVKCIHIWEDVFTQQPDLVKARVLALIGNRARLHARATEGKRIDKSTADAFLNAHHLQKSVSAYYKFGLYHKDELVAVATFSKSRIMQDGVVPYRSYELIRFASKAGVTVTGGLSKLLSLFIQEVNPAHIMTYTDRDWGTGEGYEKLGFKLIETGSPIQFFINPETFERISAKQLTPEMEARYISIFNSGSNKFVLDRRDYTS